MEANNKTYDFIIVGGGIYSCCIYYYLKKNNPESQILIIEKNTKLGGCIQTEKYNNNVIYELGANVFKLCNNSYKLIKELNLGDHIAVVNKKLVRYIYHENCMYPLYLSFFGYICFPLISFKNKIKLIYKILFKKYKHVNSYNYDISIENYMKENFDSEHYQFLLLPLIYGSSGGHGNMSALSFFSRNLKLVNNNKNSLRIWNDKINEMDNNSPNYKSNLINFNKNNLTNIKKCSQSSCAITGCNDDTQTWRRPNFIFATFNFATFNFATFNLSTFIFPIFNRSLKFIKNMFFSINYRLFKYFPMIYSNVDNKFLQHIEEEEKKKYIGKTVSLNCGLYEFIRQLKKHIHEKDILTNSELNFIEKNIKNNIWTCNIKKNNTEINIYSKNVILTVNSKMCANILRKILPIEIKNNLENFSYSSLITANIYFNKEDIKIPDNLFGLLSANINAYILGCFYASNMFLNRCENNKILLTLYIRDNNLTYQNDDQLNKTILNNLKKIFPFNDNVKPTILNVTKWKNILPAYSENYENKLKEFLNELTNQKYQNLFVDAGWITGTSISDRISSAMELSDYIIKKNII
ncbi:protoporphyrinogen oxidase, putative [Plasmodium yoelii]|uniref:Protoporphyrinogen oxidase n=3 Tax=Plasmodium yoelii TaxID=5861 RepID=A0AAE9WRD3_PLAYO|nr:protoporphyrinogen oxidase, putative [Plasmodium yoelii]EAA22471.1 protoporphyrinogen oxidase [Plasmodium yoelii yoelii]WBY55652.1 protoporphyrinogen oxidase [Plasmodium yoelii yoelii]CDU16721.1 protoporphyrinogen oxidase [Plasmodium yoelii]VTZ74268.1 protoporphyrinogen oxidase, putative [Plasmodium yoelii]|eukprot:XP_730906.1 protoporphyrinogen oxidase, putative [Plasmodium yoelii]